MGHLVLLGDSTFDNAAYVHGGPAVIDQVRQALPDGWRATLLAEDGARMRDVPAQLRRLPSGASHLALSVGGNDLLAESSVLGRPAGTVGEGLLALAEIRDRFSADFAAVLRAVAAAGLPTLVCAVYEPRFPEPAARRAAGAALGLFHDAVLGVSREAGRPVLDLRAICAEDADFANPIEPSTAGGARIARALRDVVLGHDFAAGRTMVYP